MTIHRETAPKLCGGMPPSVMVSTVAATTPPMKMTAQRVEEYNGHVYQGSDREALLLKFLINAPCQPWLHGHCSLSHGGPSTMGGYPRVNLLVCEIVTFQLFIACSMKSRLVDKGLPWRASHTVETI